jgi:hypothetical protein
MALAVELQPYSSKNLDMDTGIHPNFYYRSKGGYIAGAPPPFDNFLPNFLYFHYLKLKKKHLFVSFRELRPLDAHHGFALDPLGASRQPGGPRPPAFYCAPLKKFLDQPLRRAVVLQLHVVLYVPCTLLQYPPILC